VVSRVSERVLGSAGVRDSVEVTPIDSVLYGRYLRATQLARGSNEQRLEALRLIEEVLEHEPEYAPALYTRLALRSQTASLARPGEPAPNAESLAALDAQRREETRLLGERLLAADPDDWRGHTLLMNAAFEQGRWSSALHHAERLVQGGAARPGGARLRAQLQLYTGYVAQARANARLAAVADPLDAQAYRLLAHAHGAAGDDEEMASFAGIATEISGHRAALFEAILARRAGDEARFVEFFSQWLSTYYGDAEAARTVAEGVVEPARRDAALAALDGLLPSARLRSAGHFVEYALLEAPERSVEGMLAAARRGPAGWLEQLWWPELAEVRAQPGFSEAMEWLGLPRLWESEGAPDLCAPAPDAGWRCR
jgi:hypothetical protein